MAKPLVSEKSLNNVELQELSPVLREITTDKQGWIYRYCDRENLGRVIYSDFLALNKDAAGVEDTFVFSDDLKEEGILSLTQGFQVIAAALEDFRLAKNKDLGKDAKKQVQRLLDKIFSMVITETGHYCFDVTPYLRGSTLFTVDDCKFAYIDSMTWVMSALLSAFRLHINGTCPLDEERMKKASAIFKYCMDYLLRSFIPGENGAEGFVSGWNYTAECSIPSLYFTFAVSEVMIDILGTFENVIRSADIELLKDAIDDALSAIASAEEIAAKKEQVELAYEGEYKIYTSGTARAEREKELFFALNNGLPVYDQNSPYSMLEDAVKRAANNIWKLVGDDMSTEFFAGNLVSKISEDVIEQSIQNDALFNTVFIVNTIVNAGLDEDLEDKIDYLTPNGSAEYDEAIVEFDGLRDALRIAYDNAYQLYAKLNKKKKAYKVNEYTLAFDEDFGKQEEQVRELRKAHIRVFSLMPLLVKTKTTLGEFVIRYPQYDMQIYLENILNFRCLRKDSDQAEDFMWTWERDGYSSSSNYYFVSALNDFYNYYEVYELDVSKNAMNNKAARESLREAHLAELEKGDGTIGILRREKKEQQEQIEKLEISLKDLEEKYAELYRQYNNDPLRKAITDLVCNVVREQILSSGAIGALLSGLSEDLTESAKERVMKKAQGASNIGDKSVDAQSKWYAATVQTADPEVRALEDGLRKFGLSLLSERVLEMLFEDKKTPDYVEASYEETAEKTAQDVTQALRCYIAPMAAGQQSDYVATEGYKGLKTIIRNDRAKKKD